VGGEGLSEHGQHGFDPFAIDVGQVVEDQFPARPSGDGALDPARPAELAQAQRADTRAGEVQRAVVVVEAVAQCDPGSELLAGGEVRVAGVGVLRFDADLVAGAVSGVGGRGENALLAGGR
jgi:hypothetical protein